MTTVALAVVAALLGLAFGSFATVLIYRVPRGESLVSPRSRCPSCGASIRTVDNIPVVSYLILRGRCHACGARISLRYPATELACSALFVLAMLGFSPDLYAGVVFGLFFVLLLVVSLIDLERQIIPNAIVYPAVPAFAVAIVAGWALGSGFEPLLGLAGFLGFGGILFGVAFIYPRGMGMGDVKLAALIGLVVGSVGIDRLAVGAVSAILMGGIAGIAALVAGKGRSTRMPFGPFLAAGAVVGTFLGPTVAQWYLGTFR